jgi:hypothetical protein
MKASSGSRGLTHQAWVGPRAGRVDQNLRATGRAAVTIGSGHILEPTLDWANLWTTSHPAPGIPRAIEAVRRSVTRRPQRASSGGATLRCMALVELVTGYLDGELDAQTRARVDQHLRRCAGCVQSVEQMRVTACTVGKIRDEQLDPAFRDRLLDAFRDWN